GDQQDGTHVAIGKKPVARNLAPIIDVEGVCDGQVGAGVDQRVQVQDGAAVLPKKSMEIDACKRGAHDLTLRINAFRFAARITPNGLKISHYSVLPKKRME